ncbi:MAG: DgaE family pyridoxal phosphate-dependent ammonia lyase [Defluviitaleaceae bacterium]|nr:DgaE family pyridoxal phosphate-dependent ammonia lyase [Defluviitaleaceae bacterium]
MNANYYENKLDLKKVINASGKMTILGVSKVNKKVIDAQNYGATNFFEMDDLYIKSGKYITNLINEKVKSNSYFEDAQIVSCTSAGIAQMVATTIAENITKIQNEKLNAPFDFINFKKREVIIAKGHNINYGTPIEIMIKLGGGIVVEAGYANMCNLDDFNNKLTENTTAILYVKSHHTVQKNMLSLEDMVKFSKSKNVPLIVDAAAEEDILAYSKLGADVVIFSTSKGLNGPSSAIVLGKKKFINGLRIQNKGIGRAMKVDKSTIFGTIRAIEDYIYDISSNETNKIDTYTIATKFVDKLNKIQNINASIVKDSVREIYRASIQCEKPKIAAKIIKMQKEQSPSIYVREYQANIGIIEYDVRAISEEEIEIIIQSLKNIMKNIEEHDE